jgi:hypothetical protein
MQLEVASESAETVIAAPVPDRAREWTAEHEEIQRRLREYVRQRGALDAAESFDLLRAEQLKMHFMAGCSTIYEYLERVLGYGPHAARERMRVARSLAALPQTTAALASGDLTYSAARELTRVATAETEVDWLIRAQGKTTNEVERMTSGHRPGDLPDDPTHPDLRPRVVRIELPTEVYALWREARKVIAEARGEEIGDASFVEALCRGAIAPGSGADGPAHQIAYQQCPDCKRATQNGAGREIDVRPGVFERAACDARSLGSLDAATPERATSSVTPRLRAQVFARDHHRCTVPGCRSARNLDIHHVIEQAKGGPHELWNLTLLCSGHHAALHDGLLHMRGDAPYEIQFRWTYGPPMPFGLPLEEQRTLIRRRIEAIFERARRDDAEASGVSRDAGPGWDEEAIDPEDLVGS